jgi:hypothetical protein
VCVRYRYDTQWKKRFKTVELIVAERDWEPPAPRLTTETIVGVRIGFAKVDLRGRTMTLAATHRLPAMYDRRQIVEAGGLMSYGPNIAENHRRAATYVDKILKSAAPADLPVEHVMKFELVINLKTAKALGITIPPVVLFQADEVIR